MKNEPEWVKQRRALLLELAEITERRRVIRRQLRALEDTVSLARGIDEAAARAARAAGPGAPVLPIKSTSEAKEEQA